jgi:hypothetical protein
MNISNYRPVNQGCKLALFDVELPAMQMIFRNMAFMEKNGKRWVNFPSFCQEDPSGKKEFFPYFEFNSPEKNKALQKKLVEALEAQYLNMQEPQQEQDMPF